MFRRLVGRLLRGTPRRAREPVAEVEAGADKHRRKQHVQEPGHRHRGVDVSENQHQFAERSGIGLDLFRTSPKMESIS